MDKRQNFYSILLGVVLSFLLVPLSAYFLLAALEISQFSYYSLIAIFSAAIGAIVGFFAGMLLFRDHAALRGAFIGLITTMLLCAFSLIEEVDFSMGFFVEQFVLTIALAAASHIGCRERRKGKR